jgi:hypothetical protein
MAIKQNTANWVPIRLVDAADAPVTGLAFAALAAGAVFTLCKNGSAAAAFTVPTSGDWIEDGNGYYRVQLASGDCNTLGLIGLIAKTTTGQPWEWVDRVEAQLTSDTFARVGAPAGASVSADIAAIKAETALIQAKTTNLPASPAAVGSNMGTVTSVTGNVGGSVVGDVQGKVLGGGASAMTAAGVRAVDGSGNAIAPASTALSTAVWTGTIAGRIDAAITSRAAIADYTTARAAKLDNLDASVLAALHAALGMFVVVGSPVYNGADLVSVTVRLYDSQANANADNGVTGLITSFSRTVTYSATVLSGSNHLMTKLVGA